MTLASWLALFVMATAGDSLKGGTRVVKDTTVARDSARAGTAVREAGRDSASHLAPRDAAVGAAAATSVPNAATLDGFQRWRLAEQTSRRDAQGMLMAIGADPTVVRRPVPASTSTQPLPGTPRPAMTAIGQELRRRVSGELQLTGEGYAASGQAARRPGSSFRAQMSPRVNLGLGVTVGTDILLSSEGTELRQNISQFGLAPEWSWGKLYLGDFSREYGQYTTQGLRVRGAGLDVRRGGWRASMQGGRTQRAVARPGTELTFARYLAGAQGGYSGENGVQVLATLLRVRDDPGSVERALLIADSLALDSLVFDTLPDPFRPRPGSSTRPQDNLVAGLGLAVPLFGRRLQIRGDVSSALLTRDVTRPRVADGAGGAGALDAVFPVRLSTSGDLAWNTQAQFALGGMAFTGGFERVGAGYTSLGLGYLINDRQGMSLGASVPLLGNRVALQANVQRLEDNVAAQKAFTTRRDNLVAGITARPTSRLSLTVSGVANIVANDAPTDSARLDTRSLALTTGAALAHRFFGLAASTSAQWVMQQTRDGTPLARIPNVDVSNVTLATNLALSPSVGIAPSLSWATTATAGGEVQRNAFAGFTARARGFDNRLTGSSALSRTFTNGRQVTGARVQVTWQLPWDAALTVQGRWNAYSAFGTRPAFSESFLTVATSRPF